MSLVQTLHVLTQTWKCKSPTVSQVKGQEGFTCLEFDLAFLVHMYILTHDILNILPTWSTAQAREECSPMWLSMTAYDK